MCSGRVDLAFVLRAFLKGMDGVFIGGCRLNECNYVTHGNYDALNMVLLCRQLLAHVGLNPDRLGIEFMSAGDGILFADVVNGFTETVTGLGPLGAAEGLDPDAVFERLAEIARLAPYIKLAKAEKLASRLSDPDEYDTLFTPEEIETLLRDVASYYIDPEKCQACMICLRRCPVAAIDGGKNKIHVIDQDVCIKCGTCFEACPPRFGAVRRISGEPVPAAISEEDRHIVRKRKTSVQA